MNMLRLRSRIRLVGSAVLVLALTACSPTRIHIQHDGQGIDRLWTIVNPQTDMNAVFREGDSGKLGDLVTNVDSGNSVDYAIFELTSGQDEVRRWSELTGPRNDWFEAHVSKAPHEVQLTLKKAAFERPDLALGIVVRVNDTTGSTYFGRLLENPDIEFSGWFSSGEKYQVRLKDDARPEYWQD